MDRAISHLPMSPWEDPKLGYYVLPTAVDTIAKHDDLETVYASNTLSSKSSPNIDVAGDYNQHLDYLSKLGINPDKVWLDSEMADEGILAEVIEVGLSKGWIFHANREIYLCPCGKVEFQDVQEALHSNNNSRTIYSIDNSGKVTCDLCDGEAELVELPCLMLQLPEFNSDIEIYPDFARKEFDSLWESFKGRELLISRVADRPVSVGHSGIEYNIDADMHWMPFLHVLQQSHFLHVDTLITVHRTIKQAMLSLMTSALLESKLPSTLAVLPRVTIDFQDKDTQRAEAFLLNNGGEVTKLFLSQALGSDRKDLVLPSSLAYLISISLANSEEQEIDIPAAPTLTDYYEQPVYSWLPLALKRLRQKRYSDLTDLQKWIILNAEI